MTSTTTHISKIANVMIPVADVDEAITFYTGPLGLEKRTDLPFGDQYRWVEVAPPGADTVIAIAPPGPGDTRRAADGHQPADPRHRCLPRPAQGCWCGRRRQGESHGWPRPADVLAARPRGKLSCSWSSSDEPFGQRGGWPVPPERR